MGFEVLPELQNRAVVVSGEHVPPEGWPMHDGGWIAIVIDPQGMDLGGEFAGTHVPAGTLFVRGNYLIDRKPNPLLLGCLAQRPIVPEASGAFELLCDISSKEYGQGQAIGGILPMPLADGRMLINARSVITFPKPGKASHWE